MKNAHSDMKLLQQQVESGNLVATMKWEHVW